MLKRGMGLLGLTAMLVMAVPAVRIQASEPGVITALSEKVYLEKNIGSTVLANVLQGSTVEIIFTEMDDAGGLWFYIRTDTGLEGYLPAQSATVSVQQPEVQQEASPQEEQQEADKPKDEEQEPVEEEPQAEQKITTLDNVNIREKPTVSSRIKGNIPQGTEVSYTQSVRNEQDEVWYAVTYQGIEGYITETAVNAGQIADEPEVIETVEQEETVQTIETTESESQIATPEVVEKETEQTANELVIEEQTEADTVKSHYKIRLPEKFEVLICLGIIVCGAIVFFLLKKIKRML
ncbi:MAG: SH3 domain-containing protein [Roseburia sp.]|nr:SH3 domain-containing protein [Roseburia sp.]